MDRKLVVKDRLTTVFWFLAGNFLWAMALNLFLIGNNIAAGGFAGLATVLNSLIPIKVGTFLFMINVPLLISSFFIKGWKFTTSTLICASVYSATLNLTDFLPTLTDDPLIASVFGGVLYGLGLVCLVRSNTSAGGTDLLNRLLVVKFPLISVGKMGMIVDGTVVLTAMIAFGDVQYGLYAILTLYICSVVADKIMNGVERADLCFIITDHDPVATSQHLMKTMNRAVTKIDATGMYLGTDRSVLMMVVRPAETFRMKKEVKTIDPNAFVVVAYANEVVGGGFHHLFPKD